MFLCKIKMPSIAVGSIFAATLCLLVVASPETSTATLDDATTDSPTIDPSITLEGKCVVVCDATSLASIQRNNEYSSRSVGLTRKIAFSAARRTSNVDYFSPESADRRVVKFDQVLVNIGNAFDMHESTFKPVVGGVYSFSFTIVKVYNKYSLTVALTVNGNPVFVAYADGNKADHELAQNGGLFRLNPGDQVKIEVLEGDLNTGWQDSTFSGYLLYQDDF
ncbi:cerebellin-1-like [Clavelina lepadiformis]|uniref:cerebellin-1-like n=1 Tax=Clavelina lepadiformis TaxID=159417 RepID=UPI004040F88E